MLNLQLQGATASHLIEASRSPVTRPTSEPARKLDAIHASDPSLHPDRSLLSYHSATVLPPTSRLVLRAECICLAAVGGYFMCGFWAVLVS
jgi:hypothetical protein